jgi:hypothetical protein
MAKASRKTAKKKATQAKQVLETIAMMKGGSIDPEIQSPRVDLQPIDGYINPYHAMGSMAPNVYSAGNMLNGGMVGMPVYNPEA